MNDPSLAYALDGATKVLSATRLDTRTILWSLRVPGLRFNGSTTLSARSNLIRVSSHDGYLALVDLPARRVRECAVESEPGIGGSTAHTDPLEVVGDVLVTTRNAERTINLPLAGSVLWDRWVEAYSARDGRLLWRERASVHTTGHGRVFIGVGRGLTAHDATTGMHIWSRTTGGSMGDPRRGEGGGVPLAVSGRYLYAHLYRDERLSIHLAADGAYVGAAALPSTHSGVEETVPMPGDHVLIVLRDRVLVAGPGGIQAQRMAEWTSAGSSARHDLVRVGDTYRLAVLTPVARLRVFSDGSSSPLVFRVDPEASWVRLADTVAYVGGGRTPMLRAYDLTANGALLWELWMGSPGDFGTIADDFAIPFDGGLALSFDPRRASDGPHRWVTLVP
ncbi:hypothetical protein [Sphaerisporangium sp. TRM90804]|uniref:hypothetical protein n=1 Tax=Sphaerisporangium sp. TRM90804 TaxID=3031113 RepID=UPI00244BD341|nr:hypothetical protein [Sphaerisporangium sp. TRM90804]MDH2427060.1 hypothetical protein [Sphaerisporangium sp. TRM90804]